MTNLSETYDTPAVGTGKTLSVATYTVNDGNGGANYTVSTVTNTTGVITASVTGDTIFGNTTPTKTTSNDPNAVELGVKFESSEAGYITGVRFYKGAGNTGTHVGHLWTSTGSLLATATFTGETASGWQQVNFATPVAITAGTIYVASYFAPVGHYADDYNYFARAGDQRSADRAGQQYAGGQRSLQVRCERRVPEQHVQGEQLLGRRRVQPAASTRQPVGGPHAAFGDGDGGRGVRHAAGGQGRGPVRQPQHGRQHHVVTVARSSGAGPLQGTLTVTLSSGVATFTACRTTRPRP